MNKINMNTPDTKKKTPLKKWGCALLIGATALVASCGESLPNVSSEDGDRIPSAADAAALEIFDGRFAKLGESYYTVRVSCTPDGMGMMAESVKMFQSGKFDPDSMDEAPASLVCMELIELRDLTTEVTSGELSEADELNGITWKGVVDVGALAERRRILDLMPTLEAMLENQGATVEIPWIEQRFGWQCLDGDFLSVIAAAAGEEIPEERGEIEMPMFDMLSGMFEGLRSELLVGGEWGDWTDAGEASYQYTSISVHRDRVESSTNESVDGTLEGDTFVYRAPSKSGGFGAIQHLMQAAAAEEECQVFLVKPDVDALRAAGLID